MRFRPCIDIHDGKVKQIVGSSLNDDGAVENFVAQKDADYYALLYKEHGFYGGHIIVLNKKDTPQYELSVRQAQAALQAFRGGMQIGGGIDDKNAADFINRGAGHIIVTSYVFRDGLVNEENLKKLVSAVGREKIVLDLSCRKVGDNYIITTDRWQKNTKVAVTKETLDYFSQYCDEFLIHAVDVEGKQNGIERELVNRLSQWDTIPVTYAGGVRNINDLDILKKEGDGKIDVTIGSALSIFGGNIDFKDVVEYFN